jgi:hypothetical protein
MPSRVHQRLPAAQTCSDFTLARFLPEEHLNRGRAERVRSLSEVGSDVVVSDEVNAQVPGFDHFCRVPAACTLPDPPMLLSLLSKLAGPEARQCLPERYPIRRPAGGSVGRVGSFRMTTARRRAPDPEWVQMYRQGIPSPKIAAVAGAAESTVRFHLQRAVQEDEGLRAAHKAARGTITRKTSAGQRNLDDVIAFHKAEGRLPTTGGKTPRERALGVWLHRRRQDAAADTLSPAYREALRAIPGWDVATSKKADNEARWARRMRLQLLRLG